MRLPGRLPDCRLCEIPTPRVVYLASGGLCAACNEGIADVADTVVMERLPPAPDQFGAVRDQTVMIEGYRPPVPGEGK